MYPLPLLKLLLKLLLNLRQHQQESLHFFPDSPKKGICLFCDVVGSLIITSSAPDSTLGSTDTFEDTGLNCDLTLPRVTRLAEVLFTSKGKLLIFYVWQNNTIKVT